MSIANAGNNCLKGVNMRLNDRVCLVTAGAQGLGKALVERLAKEGAHVAVCDINAEGAQSVADEISSRYSVKTLGIGVDVTDEAANAECFRKIEDHFGRLDVLVSNAGILISGEVTEIPVADWRRVVDVNLAGYFISAREAAKIMIRQKSGVILQINSKSGKKGSFRNSAYAASKFGGIGLTQSLALELAPYGVRVNSVCPGNLLDSPLWVDSLYEQYAKRFNLTVDQVRRKYLDQVPLGRGCTYDDVANVVVFLASDEAGYMTGQAINITGGQEMG